MEAAGVVSLGSLNAEQHRMWSLILDLAVRLEPSQWVLVGGQMVTLYAAHAQVPWPRVTRDVDVLANVLTRASNFERCVEALHELGLEQRLDSRGAGYRFSEFPDRRPGELLVDLVAPDHLQLPKLVTVRSGPSVAIDGGRQALQRAIAFEVGLDGTAPAVVPVPDLLGAIVLKAAAWAADSRDRERHAQDVALLVSIVDDTAPLIARFSGSDRKRLLRLGSVLNHRTAQEWLVLGPAAAEAGHANWMELID